MSEQPGFQKIGLEEAKRRKSQAETARKVYEPDFYLNLAFFEDEQWVAYDGRGLYRPKVRSRVTLTDNKVKPAVLAEVARLSKSRPGWGATPRAIDDDAVNDAIASVRLLEWGWDHLGMAIKRRQALLWARICGAGFIRTTWDPTVGSSKEVLIDSEGKVIEHPTKGGPILKGEIPETESIAGVTTKQIGGGEVCHDVRSPFNIFPDPLATCMGDLRWLIDESVVSPEHIKERYGVVVEADAPSDVGIVQSRFHSRGVDAAAGEKLGVRLWEMWERPSPSCPQGRRLVWHDGGVLHEGPNEYGRICYSMISGQVSPGRFWPGAMVTPMRPIQARWNKLLSQIAENTAKTANPYVLIDKMAGVEFSGVPGEQIRHNGTTQRPPVELVSGESMPGYVFNLLQQMEASLREISGRYESNGSAVPAGVTAASAISLIQEQINEMLAPDVEDVELALSDVGQQTLELMAKYYSTDRVVVIVGEDGIIDVDTFRANVTFQVPDVKVVPNSTFPRSLAARQAAIRDILNMFFQYGVPIDAAALAHVLKDMQVGGLERLVQSYNNDINQAQREHVDLVRGAPLEVRKEDNDAIHIQAHQDFMKTPRFRGLPEEQQQAMNEHVDMHEMQAGAEAGPPMIQSQGLPMGPGTVPTEPSGDPMPMLDQGAPPPAQ